MSISDQYWHQLLQLKSQCDSQQQLASIIGFSEHEFVFFDDVKVEGSDFFDVIISVYPLNLETRQEVTIFSEKLYLYFATELDHQTRTHLQLYLPLATASMHHKNQSFIIAHMAQSLDGKVCTNSGSSKWIGNKENLIHAHRIRALVDGVIVGGNTARAEKPSLNVRHVEGPNPARILLCNSSRSLEGLPYIEGMRNFLLCQKDRLQELDQQALQSVKMKILGYCDKDDDKGVKAALTCLRKENIHSLLVEGGPTTIEAFLQNNALSWLQLHTAPIVFGSGHSFVSLPEIGKVDDAIKLQNVLYTQMGDAMVVTGQL